MSDIRDTILPIRPDAVWTDETCPKCDHYFVAKDQHGLYCCMDGCEWTGIKETTYMTKICKCHPHDLVYYGCRCGKED